LRPFFLNIIPGNGLNSVLKIAVSIDFLQSGTVVALISCLIVLLVILAFVLVRRIRRPKRKKFQKLFRNWLANAVTNRVLAPEKKLTISIQLEKLLLKKYYRLLALEELLICKKYLKGNAMNIVVQLYEQLQLRKETDKKLQSIIWSRVVRGIQEIYIFDQYDAMEQLFSFADNKNPFIRSEAQFGVVNLQGFEALKFLKRIQNSMSDWDHINLLHQLNLFEPKPLVEMPEWLRLENESVVLFALKLLEAYTDDQFYSNLIACLQHSNESIRKQAIRCCSVIAQENTATLLETQFEKETINNQLMILASLKRIPYPSNKEFLLQSLNHSDDRIKQLAAELMAAKFSKGLEIIQNAIKEDTHKRDQLLKHVQALI
jgi:hypothetical protein